MRIMSARPYLPGLQANPEFDLLFFALRVGAESAAQVVQLRDRLCHENGLRGRRIAADLLHITLRGVGAYDGLPHFIVERACEAGATVSTSPFPLMFDRATSFNVAFCAAHDLALRRSGGAGAIYRTHSHERAGLRSCTQHCRSASTHRVGAVAVAGLA
jgi:hypothetical protein